MVAYIIKKSYQNLIIKILLSVFYIIKYWRFFYVVVHKLSQIKGHVAQEVNVGWGPV